MNLGGIENLGITRVLQRGSGVVVKDTDNAVLVCDKNSGAYMLACREKEIGIKLLEDIKDDLNLLMVSDYELGITAFERYGFLHKLECYQVAY